MNTLAKGIVYVALGASSYGMLATFVKLAYKQGYTTAEVTMSQFVLGIVFILLINILRKRNAEVLLKKDFIKLFTFGISMGCTSIFYYLSVRYINASVAVVLLMQSVWIGVVVESFQRRKWPELNKIVAVFLVLFGTLLATNLISSSLESISFIGLFFGVLSAFSFSMTLLATNSAAPHLHPITRSLCMLLGGFSFVLFFAFAIQVAPYYLEVKILPENFLQIQPFDFSIFYTWGFLLALFGTVIPPLLLNIGFPKTGVGLGSIISSVELPISATFAFVLLKEQIFISQWVGILIILTAIVILNFNMIAKSKIS